MTTENNVQAQAITQSLLAGFKKDVDAVAHKTQGDKQLRIDAAHESGPPAPKTPAEKLKDYTGWLVSHVTMESTSSPAHAQAAAEAKIELAAKKARMSVSQKKAAQLESELARQADIARRVQEQRAEIQRLEQEQRDTHEARLEHYIAAERAASARGRIPVMESIDMSIPTLNDGYSLNKFNRVDSPASVSESSVRAPHFKVPAVVETPEQVALAIDSVNAAGAIRNKVAAFQTESIAYDYSTPVMDPPNETEVFDAPAPPVEETPPATVPDSDAPLTDEDRAALSQAQQALREAQIRIRQQLAATESLFAPVTKPQTETETDDSQPETEPVSTPTTEPIAEPTTEVKIDVPLSIAAWEVDAFRWPETSNLMCQGSKSMEILVDSVTELATSNSNRIAICGSSRCVGTTMVAMSVARLATARDQRVLLIDADVNKPDMTGLVGLSPDITWLDPNDGNTAADVIIRSKSTGICIMPMAPILSRIARPKNVFDALGGILDRVRSSFDLVLIDAGPSQQLISELSCYSNMCDAAVLVHDMYRTEQDLFEQAKAQMTRFGIPKYLVAHNFTRQPSQ